MKEAIENIIMGLFLLIWCAGWMDTLWIFGVEDSQYYTWWGLIHYLGNR